ncbi:MAG: response regulator [bacterium]|nr:response regulator [bacterium]
MAHRILLVDDEEEILSSLATYLELRGYETVATSDPLQAIDLVALKKFHVAICDINMPEMNGIDLLRNLKKNWPSLQILIMTGYGTLEKAIDCLEAGASEFIMKPFEDLEEIGEIVDLTIQRISRWENVAKKSLNL